MLTLKVYLNESGSVATLNKDFPIYQAQYNNILLNVFVPTSLLAPDFKSYVDNSIASPFVAGTAVEIASRSVERNGAYKQSKNFYLRFVKTLMKDNVEYALYERKLPKEMVLYAGQGINAPEIIINVVNVKFGEITRYEVVSSNPEVQVEATQKSTVLPITKIYTFVYGVGDKWYLNGYEVDLSKDYGITVIGNPKQNDTIALQVVASSVSTISVMTSQTVKYDVLPSSDLDKEVIESNELESIEAYLNSLRAFLDEKQDKTDDDLNTIDKTVVGAINGLNNAVTSNLNEINSNASSIQNLNSKISNLEDLVTTGENYIGTYFFQAENAGDLPTNEELLAFVRIVKGETYNLKNGDSLIVVVAVEDQADKRYKYIYNGTKNEWSEYEILPIETAKNGIAGIIYGTYGINSVNDIVVDIDNGEIKHIYIKDKNGVYNIDLRNEALKIQDIIDGNIEVGNSKKATQDGLGRNIAGTYLTKTYGATRQFVIENTLSKQFNQMFYLSGAGLLNTVGEYYNSVLVNTNEETTLGIFSTNGGTGVPIKLNHYNGFKGSIPLQFTTEAVGEQAEVKVGLKLFKFSNSSYYDLGIATTIINVSPSISVEHINFEQLFNLIQTDTVYEYGKDDSLVLSLDIRWTGSSELRVDLSFNSTTPAYMRLAVDSNSIVGGKVLNSIGDSEVDTMSQKSITEYATPIDVKYTELDETNVLYDTESGMTFTSVATDMRNDNEVLNYTTEINLPIIVGGDLSADTDENGKHIVIHGASKLLITLVTPQQTNGTLTEEQLAYLQSKDSNYIEIDDGDGHIERYTYSTNASESGYRVYTHIEDETVKSFTITESVRSWVIQELNISEALNGKLDIIDKNNIDGRLCAYTVDGSVGGKRKYLPIENSTTARKSNIVTYVDPNTSMLNTELGGGVLVTNAPTQNYHATNKQYVDDGLSECVKIDTETSKGLLRLYGMDSGGNQTIYVLITGSNNIGVGRIPRYVSDTTAEKDGNFATVGYLVTADPKNPYHCANKLYVDAQKVYKHRVMLETPVNEFSFEYYSTSATAISTFDEIPTLYHVLAINSFSETYYLGRIIGKDISTSVSFYGASIFPLGNRISNESIDLMSSFETVSDTVTAL